MPLTNATSLPSTWWDDTSYSIVEWGTGVLNKVFGTSPFPFAKSVYAVTDSLKVAGASKPDALIVDLFGGSGTTLHATCLLNAEDEGSRRAILVTNNEVNDEVARELRKAELYRGDPSYEAHGIFEAVTRPRTEAVISGVRRDGCPVPGNYKDGEAFSDGFPENVQFFRLDYLNPDDVELRRQFDAIVPSLWLAAGGIGHWELSGPEMEARGYSLPADAPYGVLLDVSRFTDFRDALASRPDVTHVYLVTDAEEAFAEMRADLPRRLKVGMLYRDYLRSFRINMENTR